MGFQKSIDGYDKFIIFWNTGIKFLWGLVHRIFLKEVHGLP